MVFFVAGVPSNTSDTFEKFAAAGVQKQFNNLKYVLHTPSPMAWHSVGMMWPYCIYCHGLRGRGTRRSAHAVHLGCSHSLALPLPCQPRLWHCTCPVNLIYRIAVTFALSAPFVLLSPEGTPFPSPLPHVSHTSPTRLPHVSHTSPTRLPHVSHTSPTRLPHVSHTSPTRLPHVSHATPTPLPHLVHSTTTRLLHLSHTSPTHPTSPRPQKGHSLIPSPGVS